MYDLYYMSGSDKNKATFYTIINELDNNNNKINGKIIMPQTTLQFNGKMGRRKCPRTTNWPIHDQPNNQPTEHHQFLYASLSMVKNMQQQQKRINYSPSEIVQLKYNLFPPHWRRANDHRTTFLCLSYQTYKCTFAWPRVNALCWTDEWLAGWLKRGN